MGRDEEEDKAMLAEYVRGAMRRGEGGRPCAPRSRDDGPDPLVDRITKFGV